ncbi:Glutathione S-transferase omega-1 [Gaertneriomyces sp. JEL0708]|nr:Glutathione S-transferase omega-1 [Gaertneriomyces sp. JEL0708]
MSKPTSPPQVLRLFPSIVCPYSQRARWALRALELPHEIVEIDLTNKPEWYSQINSKGKVPALELPTGDVFTESMVILWYLEELAAKEGKGLLPEDPYLRAQIRLSIATFESAVQSPIYAALRNNDIAQKDHLNNAILSGLDEFFATVPIDKPINSFLTIATFPFVERLKGVTYWRGLEIPKQHERLRKWIETVEKDETYQKIRAEEGAMIAQLEKFAKQKM